MYRYSYKELIDDLAKILPKLEVCRYDTILAIARGGMSIAHILGENLNIRDVYTINSIGYNHTQKLDNIKVFNIPNELKKSKKVLIVDDISDSGSTLQKVVDILTKKYKNIEFYTYTLYYKKTSIYKPTYYSKEADDWIEFYWSEKI